MLPGSKHTVNLLVWNTQSSNCISSTITGLPTPAASSVMLSHSCCFSATDHRPGLTQNPLAVSFPRNSGSTAEQKELPTNQSPNYPDSTVSFCQYLEQLKVIQLFHMLRTEHKLSICLLTIKGKASRPLLTETLKKRLPRESHGAVIRCTTSYTNFHRAARK